MRTEKQINANRQNAKKSSGPRTPKGKTRTAQNALKHGLLAQDSVIPSEEAADFDNHLTAIEDSYLPRNRVEKEIVRQIADVMWRMQRLSRIESSAIAASIERTRDVQKRLYPDRMKEGHEGEVQLLGTSMLNASKFLNNLARYDGHLSRRFFRSVELMMSIRRQDEKKLESFETQNAEAVSPGRYIPDQAPPPNPNYAQPRAPIGFRPNEKSAPNPSDPQWGRSPDLPGDQPKTTPSENSEIQTRATAPSEKSGPITRATPSAKEKPSPASKSPTGAVRTVPHFSAVRPTLNPENKPKTNQKIPNKPKTNLTNVETTSYSGQTAPETEQETRPGAGPPVATGTRAGPSPKSRQALSLSLDRLHRHPTFGGSSGAAHHPCPPNPHLPQAGSVEGFHGERRWRYIVTTFFVSGYE